MVSSTLHSKTSPLLFTAPSILVLGLMLLSPILLGIGLSFFDLSLSTINSLPKFVGLKNYQELFISENFWGSVRVTIVFVTVVVITEIILGTVLALLLEEGLFGLRVLRTLFVLPIMVAPVVVGVIWKFLYHSAYGKINYFLGLVGIKQIEWLAGSSMALISVIITDVWQWTPFVFLLILAGLQSIPIELTEAATVDGASYLQNLWHIKLPYLAGVIGITAILRLIDAFRGLEVIFNLTYGGPGVSTEVLSLHLYKAAFVNQRLGVASAIAVVLMALILALSAVLISNTTRVEKKRG